MKRAAAPGRRSQPPERRGAAEAPLSDRDIDELQRLLDAVPAPLEPLDVSSLDGFLCGVLVLPERVSNVRWLACITDHERRPLPRDYDPARLHAMALRRHAELDVAIGRRRWFDPWVFEIEDGEQDPAQVVFPWVAGVATAFELFPGLAHLPEEATAGPLALLYRHLDPEDLEDADELLAEIDGLEPVAHLEEAVEGLVRAILQLADLTRPIR